MQAVRCLVCGDTRWSLFSRSAEALLKPCELCGGGTARERRSPGAGPDRLAEERRSVALASAPPSIRPERTAT
jgi:hypothetical protein